MMSGALGYRLPARAGDPRAGRRLPSTAATRCRQSLRAVSTTAWRTRQFWLLWAVLCLNVTAGIGVIGMASPLLQEVFRGADRRAARLHRARQGTACADRRDRSGLHRTAVAVQHRGQDLLGIALRSHRPQADVRDLFPAGIRAVRLACRGPRDSGISRCSSRSSASSCRCMAAASRPCPRIWPTCSAPRWSARSTAVCSRPGPSPGARAGARQLHPRVPDRSRRRARRRYSITMYILAGLLLIGFVCNSLIRPVDERLFVAADSPATSAREAAAAIPTGPAPSAEPGTSSGWRLWGAWLAVGIPNSLGRQGDARESGRAV